jgi:uncharacterized RDD family membrane protein YckC
MRCPKCHYISYDSGDRCRNCGYEFSLSAEEPADVDVAIRRDDLSPGRMHDGSLGAIDAPLAPPALFEDDPGVDESLAGRRLPTAGDLPLFTERIADDQAPLITPPAVPRAPLSVRRTNPSGRARRSPEPEELSLDLEDDQAAAASGPLAAAVPASDVAGLGRRAGAGVVDLLILGSLVMGVVYLTLRLCELTFEQWRLLPPVPLAAFLLLLCCGYFALFTAAGGQTIGKMIARIRVIAMTDDVDERRRVPFGSATMRAVACLGSLLAVGAGFLPVFFSPDRRAFHDRVAQTRVVAA